MAHSRRIAWAAAFSLMLSACAGGSSNPAAQPIAPLTGGPAPADASGGGFTDVGGIEELRAKFGQDDGSARLVLLLSPT